MITVPLARLASASAVSIGGDGEAHVGALGGRSAGGHQEELPERHRVVDAERAGVGGRGVDQRAERRGVGRGHRDGGERRELPVLAGGAEVVGRRADVHAGHGDVAVGPGARPVGDLADGEVEIEAEAHAGGERRLARLAELAVGEPLQPGVEADLVGVALGEGGDGGALRVLQLRRPAGPAGAVAIGRHAGGDRLEAGVALERLAAGGAEAVEGLAVAAALCQSRLSASSFRRATAG